MKVSACLGVVLLVIALSQAGPTPKVAEKKSLVDDVKLETKAVDLKIKETGEDKERAKKSAASFCVQIDTGSSQPTQISCKDNQAETPKVPLTIQTQTIPQHIQTFNVVQPVAQIPQANVVVPQPVAQPFQALQIVQPALQPCVQSIPAVSIIQSAPQSNIVQTNSKSEPKPKPAPVPAPVTEVKPTTEKPRPLRIEQAPQPLPQPQETLSILPVASPCHQHAIAIPSSPVVLVSEPEPAQFTTVVRVPPTASCNNPLHGIIGPCTCQDNVAVLSEPSAEAMPMKIVPIMSYSSFFPGSSFRVPYDSKLASYITPQKEAGSQPRTSTHVHVNVPAANHHHYDQQNYHKIYQKTLIRGVDTIPFNPYTVGNLIDNVYVPSGITINAYPHVLQGSTMMQQPQYRSSESIAKNGGDASNIPVVSEASNLQRTNKVPRQVGFNQLSPEKLQEIEEEKGRAFLIDGRRNTRSNKKETKSEISISSKPKD